jgi:RNA polymerase sigma-70 factor (ECF subfamily)
VTNFFSLSHVGPTCVDRGVGSDTDLALVVLLQRGDPAAFGRVYEAYGPRIFRFLARMCVKKELAEDIYQETWIKLALHARRLEEDTDLGAWLYTVARNLARSERRAQTSRPASEELAGDAVHTGASPFDWAAATETQKRLELALGDLPTPLREVLLLVVVEDVEQERAAAILDLTPEALRQRLSRARAKLAEALDERTKPGRSRTEE